jgi:hypothetical protein
VKSNGYLLKLETDIGLMVLSLDPKDNKIPGLCGSEEKFNKIKTLLRFQMHKTRREMNKILKGA